MKTEEFDDAVRKKLESIDPAFSESDIDKVLQHVSEGLPSSVPRKGLGGSWLLYSLSAAAFVSITTLAVYRSVHKKELAEAGPNVTNKIDVPAPEVRVAAADSVFVDDTASLGRDEAAAVLPEAKPADSFQIANHPVAKQKAANMAAANVAMPAGSVNLKQQQNDQQVPSPENVPELKIDAAAIVEPPAAENAEIKNDITDYREVKVQHTEKDTVYRPERAISATAVSGQPEVILTPAPGKTSKTKRDAGTNSAPPTLTNWSIAPAFSLSNQGVGAELSGRVIVFKHLLLSAGARSNWLQTEKFADKLDMRDHRPHGSNDKVDQFFADREHARAITIKSTLLQIPVSIGYWQPLARGVAVNAGLGTGIDILLKQSVSYDQSPDTLRHDRQLFRTRGKAVPLNSIDFNMGITKSWNRAGIGLQPYLNLPVKKVFYKPEKPEIGFRLLFEYRF